MTPRHPLTALAACALLAACGGGSSEVGATQAPPAGNPVPPALEFPQIGLAVPPVRADGSPVAAADYLGRTFPLLALVGSPRANPVATIGEIAFGDGDTLVIRLPGRAPLTLDRSGASILFGDGNGGEWLLTETVSDEPAQLHLTAIRGGLFEASFGFETPVAARPATATYIGSSTIALDLDGGRITPVLQGNGDVDLTATFTGSGGTIRGILMDTSGSRDITGDGVRDELFLRAELDGVIVPDGFTGTISATASAQVAGETAIEDLDLRLSNQVVAGKFFGNAAEAASGVFGAEVTATVPGRGALSGTLAGHFRSQAP
jgi:hypothetical protein